jgi:hypothetical protein
MNDTSQLKTNLHELTKSYAVYDISSRISELYEARTNAGHGDPCIKTTLTYVGLTLRVLKRKEEISTWDSSYDI